MVHHSSRIELSQSALRKNIAFIRNRVGQHPILSIVVKANAYGHGIRETVPMLEKCGVRHFSVASGFEAKEVLEAKREDSKILIMGILYDVDLPWVIENDLEFYVFDLARLRQAEKVAGEMGRPAKIHLEIETGGHRTGLALEDLDQALAVLKMNKKFLEFVGVCTHLAGAETVANQFRINRQLEVFAKVRQRVKEKRHEPQCYHMVSSSGAIIMPELAMDLVRVGTAAYGLWPSPDVYNLYLINASRATANPLHQVLSWKTDLMHIKFVPCDGFVGYGTSFQAPRDMLIGIVPIGYGNGFPRVMSNRGHVLIRGKRAPVVGLVNMNMFAVDVTHIKDVAIGDEVVLVGRQKNNVITLRSFSEFATSLNTEFVSRLPSAIPRSPTR